MAVKRTYYKDKYNDNKVWEVVKLSRGYYLRQYICGKQFGRGMQKKKKHIQSLGIFDFEKAETRKAQRLNQSRKGGAE